VPRGGIRLAGTELAAVNPAMRALLAEAAGLVCR